MAILLNLFSAFQDVERLQQKSHKVFQSLHYVQDAVDKGILELLPGSITVVLETVMELNQLLGNYFIDQDRYGVEVVLLLKYSFK